MASFRSLLFEISKQIVSRDLDTMKHFCTDYGIGAKCLEDMKSARDLFKELEKRQLLGPDNTGILVYLLEKADRIDLKNEVLSTQDRSRAVPQPAVPDSPVANGKPTLKDSHLNEIAEDLGRDWKPLGRKLGVPSSILDNFDTEYRYVKEKAFQMMSRWKRRSGNNATEQVLTTALISIGRKDIAEHLAKCIANEEKPENVDGESVQSRGGLDTIRADLGLNLPMQESGGS